VAQEVQETPRWSTMSLFDDNSLKPPDEAPHAPFSSDRREESATEETGAHPLIAQPLGGDPLSYVAVSPAASAPSSNLPEDLRISWSWPHLLVFAIFFLASQFIIGAVVVTYYATYRHMPQKQLKHLLESDPQILVATSILSFALIMLFLYVTLSVLRERPFWQSLGWKKLEPDPMSGKGKPWMYFISGCGLSIFVAIASSRVKDAEHAPIEEFFKSRDGAILLMGMAVFVAPLVEETIFRGYLYPVLARIFSAVAEFFGVESPRAIRAGVVFSILLTGFLFGLMHAPQLGGNWGLVSLLVLVGIIFTFARAWTGTVVASFLLHLGYNSMIAVTSIIATHGFTQMPRGH
jgi:membrane protease YdiL (CAAX protease family)